MTRPGRTFGAFPDITNNRARLRKNPAAKMHDAAGKVEGDERVCFPRLGQNPILLSEIMPREDCYFGAFFVGIGPVVASGAA